MNYKIYYFNVGFIKPTNGEQEDAPEKIEQ